MDETKLPQKLQGALDELARFEEKMRKELHTLYEPTEEDVVWARAQVTNLPDGEIVLGYPNLEYRIRAASKTLVLQNPEELAAYEYGEQVHRRMIAIYSRIGWKVIKKIQ